MLFYFCNRYSLLRHKCLYKTLSENKIFGKSFLFKTLPLLPIYNSIQKRVTLVFLLFFNEYNIDLSLLKERRKRRKKKPRNKTSKTNGINTCQLNPIISRTLLPFLSQVTVSKSKRITEEEICLSYFWGQKPNLASDSEGTYA